MMSKENGKYEFGKRKEGVNENVLSQERLEEIKRGIQDCKAVAKVAREKRIGDLIHENYVLRCRVVELEEIVQEMERELYRVEYGEERIEECD